MNDVTKTPSFDPIISIVKEVAEFAFAFGSMKTGRVLPESDIDLAVYLKKQRIHRAKDTVVGNNRTRYRSCNPK